MKKQIDTTKLPVPEMVKYSLGACTESLLLNSFFAFSMLYYTKALGLSPILAGQATFIATLWDAITDPIMGHITDNTRSRFGRRHPYILSGGLLLALSFFFLWFVPDIFSAPGRLFRYLLILNLIVRTAVTIFVVPYTALGFEICTDYDERAKLQSARAFLNQIVNFAGGALAWSLFFRDQVGADGTRIDGTRIEGNCLSPEYASFVGRYPIPMRH